MKTALFALAALLLSGCAASWPETASLNPVVNDQPDRIYGFGTRASFDGSDRRLGSQIIRIKLGNEPVVMIPNNVNPAQLLAERLAEGLGRQGLTQSGAANVGLTLEVHEMMAEVSKPGLLYQTNTKVRLKLVVDNQGNVLSKEYNKGASKESATRPDIYDLEMRLNEQLTQLLDQMLADTQIRSAIKGQG